MTNKTKLTCYIKKAYADKIIAYAKANDNTVSKEIEKILMDYVDKIDLTINK